MTDQRGTWDTLRRVLRNSDFGLNLFGFRVNVTRLLRDMRRKEDDLDKQVEEAFDALSKSSRLIDDLGVALREREDKLTLLKAEHRRISELSTLTQPQAEAVAASLQKVLGQASKRERIYAFIINLAAGLLIFVLGVIASDWINLLLS